MSAEGHSEAGKETTLIDSILNKLALVSPPSARAISDYPLAVWRD